MGYQDHIVDEELDTERCTALLEKYARERFNPNRTAHRWSELYYILSDGNPYIMKSSGKKIVFVPTGYDSDRVIFGTVATHL